jgi:hypothetical protein
MSAANIGKRICQRFPIKATGQFSNVQPVVDELAKFKLGISRKRATAIVHKCVNTDSFLT